jgi:hypothetical protein
MVGSIGEDMDWWNAPAKEFVKIPWDQISEGCHLVNNKVMCYNYEPTNPFFQSIDPKVVSHRYENILMDLNSMFAVVVLLLIVFGIVWFEKQGVLQCDSIEKPL